MDKDVAPPAKPEISDTDLPASDQVRQLFGDFRTLAEAEFDYYRARMAYGKKVAKWTGFYIAVTLFTLFGTVVAGIIGLLMILADFIGPVWATCIVTIFFAAVTVGFAQLARRSARNLSFSGTDDGQK